MAYQPKGYTYNPMKHRSKPYHAQMSVNRQTVSLGYFATPEEATATYLKERAKIPRLPNKKARV